MFHTPKLIESLSARLTKAIKANAVPGLDPDQIVSWGPRVSGTEEVDMLTKDPAQLEQTRSQLALSLTGGDESFFSVTHSDKAVY